jgi:hypothetical protein
VSFYENSISAYCPSFGCFNHLVVLPLHQPFDWAVVMNYIQHGSCILLHRRIPRNQRSYLGTQT